MSRLFVSCRAISYVPLGEFALTRRAWWRSFLTAIHLPTAIRPGRGRTWGSRSEGAHQIRGDEHVSDRCAH